MGDVGTSAGAGSGMELLLDIELGRSRLFHSPLLVILWYICSLACGELFASFIRLIILLRVEMTGDSGQT